MDASTCPALTSKVTNSPVTSVLRCIPAANTRLSLGSALLHCISGCANHIPCQRMLYHTASRERCKPCILPISTQNTFPFYCPSSQSQKEIQIDLKSYVWDGYVQLQFCNQNLKKCWLKFPCTCLLWGNWVRLSSHWHYSEVSSNSIKVNGAVLKYILWEQIRSVIFIACRFPIYFYMINHIFICG